MSRSAMLAFAAALLLAHAGTAVAGDAALSCDFTSCDTSVGYFPVPLSSSNHPSKTSTCTPCGGSGCSATPNTGATDVDDTCQECCFKRNCNNYGASAPVSDGPHCAAECADACSRVQSRWARAWGW